MFMLRNLWDTIDVSFGLDPDPPQRSLTRPRAGLEMPADLRALLMQDFSETVPAATWVQQDLPTSSWRTLSMAVDDADDESAMEPRRKGECL